MLTPILPPPPSTLTPAYPLPFHDWPLVTLQSSGGAGGSGQGRPLSRMSKSSRGSRTSFATGSSRTSLNQWRVPTPVEGEDGGGSRFVVIVFSFFHRRQPMCVPTCRTHPFPPCPSPNVHKHSRTLSLSLSLTHAHRRAHTHTTPRHPSLCVQHPLYSRSGETRHGASRSHLCPCVPPHPPPLPDFLPLIPPTGPTHHVSVTAPATTGVL